MRKKDVLILILSDPGKDWGEYDLIGADNKLYCLSDLNKVWFDFEQCNDPFCFALIDQFRVYNKNRWQNAGYNKLVDIIRKYGGKKVDVFIHGRDPSADEMKIKLEKSLGSEFNVRNPKSFHHTEGDPQDLMKAVAEIHKSTRGKGCPR